MSELTAPQVAAVAYGAGFRGASLHTAIAVSFAENGTHDTNAAHKNADGSTDYGLWQINSVHGIDPKVLATPQGNAQAAYRISSSGRNWQPWTTYNSGAYAAHLPAAGAAITDMNASGGAKAVARGIGKDSGGGGGFSWTGAAESGLAGAAFGPLGALFAGGNVPGLPSNPLTSWIGDLQKVIADYALRAFEMLGGLILMLVGLFLIAKDLGMAPPMPSVVPIPV